MQMPLKTILALLISILYLQCDAQEIILDSLIKFSGIVVNERNLDPIPQTNIVNINRKKGTSADNKGLFKFQAKRNDTILFSAIGYKTQTFIVPDTITKNNYSLFQIMTNDTIILPETSIYPFPTWEELKKEIAEMKTEEEIQNEIVKQNLLPVKQQLHSSDYEYDAKMNFRNFIQNETRKLRYSGQVQPMPIFDIFAWGRFVEAWKKGKFKKKDEK